MRNCASLMFIRCMVLDRAVFLKPTASNSMKLNSEVFSGWKQEKQPYLMNDTMYKPWTCAVVLLRTVHYNDSHILALVVILGRLKPKGTKIQCPIIDTVTLLDIQKHPSVFEAATITKCWRAAAGS